MTTGPLSHTSEPWKAPARRAALWSTAVALLLVGVSVVVTLGWRGDLPDPVGSHWSSGPGPDDFQSFAAWLTTVVAISVPLVVLFAAVCWFWGRTASARRTAAFMTVWAGGLLATANIVVLGGQRGLADATQARLPGLSLLAIVLLPVVPAVTAAALVRRDPPQPTTAPVPTGASRLSLGEGERAAWIRQIGGGPGLWVGGATVVLTLLLSILLREWGLLLVPAFLALLFAAMMVFQVRVDASGLRVRSALGWPRTFVPADEVVEARVVEVFAFRQFGGWGWRFGPGGHLGVVPRSGRGIEVVQTGGRSLTITVDDAETGAALLNTMADRAR